MFVYFFPLLLVCIRKTLLVGERPKGEHIFLQETYSESNDENVWRKEWGGELFFSHGTKHSKGVCILINPTEQFQVDYSYSNN